MRGSKSRSLRRVFVKTPGGKTVKHFRKRKTGKARCAVTGKILHGVPHTTVTRLRNLSITKKRPSRPFGGNLSGEAMRKRFADEARKDQGSVEGSDILIPGRLCTKLAGRDAGRACVIVDVHEKGLVTIDGDVRRKKCNVNHLFFSPKVLKIKKGASHSEVSKVFESESLPVWETKKKEVGKKPVRQRKKKEKVDKKDTKKEVKKPAENTTEKKEVKKPVEKKVEKPKV